MRTFETYPRELQREEMKAIRRRREIVASAGYDRPKESAQASVTNDAQASSRDEGTDHVRSTPASDDEVPLDDTVGLCLSGGGVRSATFCLGFLQALAKRGLLRQIDWLSTVSGGGYIGSFLGRFYDRLTDTPVLASDIVETSLSNSSSAAVNWLRQHGDYLAPAGKADWSAHFGAFLRNLLTVQLVVGTFLFGLYGLANGVRYGLLERLTTILPYLNGFSWSDMPLGRLIFRAGLGTFWSPWFILVEFVLLLCAAPRAIGYWLASQDDVEGFSPPTLVIVLLTLLALLRAGVSHGLDVTALLLTAPLLLAFPIVERTWCLVRRDNRAAGSGGPKVEQLRARTRLTREFGTLLMVSGVLLYLAIIDTLGHALFEAHVRNNISFAAALAQLVTGLAMLFPILRRVAFAIANQRSEMESSGQWAKLFSQPAVSAVLSVLLFAPPLLVISVGSHALYREGDAAALSTAVLVTLGALLISAIIAFRWAMPVVNRSSLQATYAARVARAYLGASNPSRQLVISDDVAPGDDVDTLLNYKPFEAGGPLHLINVCVNQTVDQHTLRSGRARKGVNLACSSLGLSIDRFFHAVWDSDAAQGGNRQTVRAVGHVPGTDHPLLGIDEKPPETLDILPLRDWVSISGAAFGPGMGSSTSAALSALFFLANLRTGYWWNSGLTSGERGVRPRVSFTNRLLWLLPNLFPTQRCLFNEAFASFRGPWDRFWYLSDGGHFDNLGGYELIRRQVPVIIMIDAGADPDFDMDDFANFQRRVRIDFHAEIEPIGVEQWKEWVHKDLTDHKDRPADESAARAVWDTIEKHIALAADDGGALGQLMARTEAGRLGLTVKKHASLFRVTYPFPQGKSSLLLYVKASLNGDESADILHYHVEHPDFPFENTADQFFGESQWESYRRLGEHIGDTVLGPADANGEPSELWLKKLRR
jgi:hypothetical protein